MSNNVYTVDALADIIKQQMGVEGFPGMDNRGIVATYLADNPQHRKHVDPSFFIPAADPGSIGTKVEVGFHQIIDKTVLGVSSLADKLLNPETWWKNQEKFAINHLSRAKAEYEKHLQSSSGNLARMYQGKGSVDLSYLSDENKLNYYAEEHEEQFLSDPYVISTDEVREKQDPLGYYAYKVKQFEDELQDATEWDAAIKERGTVQFTQDIYDITSNFTKGFADQLAEETNTWIENDPKIQAYMRWMDEEEYTWTNRFTNWDMAQRAILDLMPSIAMMLGPGKITKGFGLVTGGLSKAEKVSQLASVAKGLSSTSKWSTSLGNTFDKYSLMTMVGMESGEMYSSTRADLLSQGLSSELAHEGASLAAITYGPLSGLLEKFQIMKMGKFLNVSNTMTTKVSTAILKGLTKGKSVGSLARLGKTGAAVGTIFNWTANSFEEGIIEGYQAGLDHIVSAAIDQGYGKDADSAWKGLMHSMSQEFGDKWDDLLLPPISNITEIKQSFLSAQAGTMIMGSAGGSVSSMKAYSTWKDGMSVEVKDKILKQKDKNGNTVGVVNYGSNEEAEEAKRNIQKEGRRQNINIRVDSENNTIEDYAMNVIDSVLPGGGNVAISSGIIKTLKKALPTKVVEALGIKDTLESRTNVNKALYLILKYSGKSDFFKELGYSDGEVDFLKQRAAQHARTLSSDTINKYSRNKNFTKEERNKISQDFKDKFNGIEDIDEIIERIAAGEDAQYINDFLDPETLAKLEEAAAEKASKKEEGNLDNVSEQEHDRSMADQAEGAMEDFVQEEMRKEIASSLAESLKGQGVNPYGPFKKMASNNKETENQSIFSTVFVQIAETGLDTTRKRLLNSKDTNATVLQKIAKGAGIDGNFTESDYSNNKKQVVEEILLAAINFANVGETLDSAESVDLGVGDSSATTISTPKPKQGKPKTKLKKTDEELTEPEDSYDGMTVSQFKAELKSRKLPVSGNKATLKDRLQKDDAVEVKAKAELIAQQEAPVIPELRLGSNVNILAGKKSLQDDEVNIGSIGSVRTNTSNSAKQDADDINKILDATISRIQEGKKILYRTPKMGDDGSLESAVLKFNNKLGDIDIGRNINKDISAIGNLTETTILKHLPDNEKVIIQNKLNTLVSLLKDRLQKDDASKKSSNEVKPSSGPLGKSFSSFDAPVELGDTSKTVSASIDDIKAIREIKPVTEILQESNKSLELYMKLDAPRVISNVTILKSEDGHILILEDGKAVGEIKPDATSPGLKTVSLILNIKGTPPFMVSNVNSINNSDTQVAKYNIAPKVKDKVDTKKETIETDAITDEMVLDMLDNMTEEEIAAALGGESINISQEIIDKEVSDNIDEIDDEICI